MADKVTKFLRKLNEAELLRVKSIIALILAEEVGGLNVKKLSGHADLYRVRVGRIRIIFRVGERGNQVVQVAFRDDQTYRDF